MAALLRCIDSLGRAIVLEDFTWNNHILPRHAEMADQIGVIEQTLTQPDAIHHDARNAKRESFYRKALLPSPYQNDYVKVSVEFRRSAAGRVTGRVLSAYAISRVKRTEVKKWPE
ncbi:MAG: hypothetical protein ACR2OO_03695 [Thermomicrobiales bacterium]